MQYGFDALSLMPTSLHGPGVNYHPTYSHALPALSRRFHGAHAPSITRWGTHAMMGQSLLRGLCVFAGALAARTG